jgi:hypothetical protein
VRENINPKLEAITEVEMPAIKQNKFSKYSIPPGICTASASFTDLVEFLPTMMVLQINY